jgi:phenylacetate-coenzyme A ligase PaaK-like adenylate-forming protein
LSNFKSFEADLQYVNEQNFEEIALRLFCWQAAHNPVYRDFVAALGVNPSRVTSLARIPFLPISFFKTHFVASGQWLPDMIFTSSGTSGANTSRHAVPRLDFYLQHATAIFEGFYGKLTDYVVLALLPGYLERQGSSLVAMADHFIKASGSPLSGFFLHQHRDLLTCVQQAPASKKILLLGVSFALLHLAEDLHPNLNGCVVMETGGMKGRRKEMTREELHAILTQTFAVPAIHSEYGMTELLSQAYSWGAGLFQCPPAMRVLLRDLNDPFDLAPGRPTGGINVIDLANIYSCAFVETQDLGRLHKSGHFEVLGRIDNADIRGCNLLVG